MTIGSTLIGYLVAKDVKIHTCRKEHSLRITSADNEALTENGVYAYEVHKDGSVDIYGTLGFMTKKELQEKEIETLKDMNYSVRSIRP